jgi:pyruvate,orthophosphate dikinase
MSHALARVPLRRHQITVPHHQHTKIIVTIIGKRSKKMDEKKWIYLFDELEEVEKYVGGEWDQVRTLLGGKGANLAEMVRIGAPIPPGFTVTTEACNAYLDAGGKFPSGMWDQELTAMQQVEAKAQKQFGNPENPLLISCRSGGKFSMPGMMDTVLNIGLNDETAQGMIRLTNNERFVYDSYRRLIQMFGAVVMGLPECGRNPS